MFKEAKRKPTVVSEDPEIINIDEGAATKFDPNPNEAEEEEDNLQRDILQDLQADDDIEEPIPREPAS